MVRVGGSNVPPEVIAAYKTPTEEVLPHLSGYKDKKKGKKGKKGKNKKPTPQQEQDYAEIHADELPTDGTQGAQRPPVLMPVTEQTEIDVSSRVGLPPRVRFVQNCVRKVKENGRDENTVIVGVDDMEILFEFFGYPV